MLREDSVAQDSNGYEAIRRIQADIEPTSSAAAIGLLETILNIPAPPKGTALRDAIIGMERLFVDYEATSKTKLSEHLKIATLRRLLPAELRVHVNLLVKDDSNYEAVKKTVSEYEVADRRFEPLRAEAVYDHGGVAPMEVDQIKGFGGKGKGKSKDKPKCPTCGKNHAGKCWSKGKDGKGKSKGKQGGDHKGGKGREEHKPKLQICGKTGHGADKCFQRYKDKEKTAHVQAALAGAGTGSTTTNAASPGGGGSVAVLAHRDVSTSPESELRVTTTGVRGVTAMGQALALLDSGSDEHMCPETFASWIPAHPLNKAPRLRDAQGVEIKHACMARTVKLKLRAEDGTYVKLVVTFLIGPVKQPILSVGKLTDQFQGFFSLQADKPGGVGFHTAKGRMWVEIQKVQNSFYLPFFLEPPDADGAAQVRAISVTDRHVKFREHLSKNPPADSEYSEFEEEEKVAPRSHQPRRWPSKRSSTRSRERLPLRLIPRSRSLLERGLELGFRSLLMLAPKSHICGTLVVKPRVPMSNRWIRPRSRRRPQ